MNTSPCWICGNPADSAEHMIKASDFRGVFGRVTQSKPVLRSSPFAVNQPVKGANAQVLKFTPSICAYCNNSRTQAHDRAWEALSKGLRETRPALVPGVQLPLQRIFGAHAKQSMLDVHLYFLKLLGCYAVEYSVPLPIRAFAVAILSGVAHPHIYLGFVVVKDSRAQNEIFVGHIQALRFGTNLVAATWFYVVAGLGVHVGYVEPGHPRFHKRRGWHPDQIGIKIAIR